MPVKTSAGQQRGRPFPKGRSPNPKGRPKGVPNKATAEVKQACAELVDNPAYREKLAQRLVDGKLAPAIECMLWHYAKGKPKEQLEHTGRLEIGRIVDELHP